MHKIRGAFLSMMLAFLEIFGACTEVTSPPDNPDPVIIEPAIRTTFPYDKLGDWISGTSTAITKDDDFKAGYLEIANLFTVQHGHLTASGSQSE